MAPEVIIKIHDFYLMKENRNNVKVDSMFNIIVFEYALTMKMPCFEKKLT